MTLCLCRYDLRRRVPSDSGNCGLAATTGRIGFLRLVPTTTARDAAAIVLRVDVVLVRQQKSLANSKHAGRFCASLSRPISFLSTVFVLRR